MYSGWALKDKIKTNDQILNRCLFKELIVYMVLILQIKQIN